MNIGEISLVIIAVVYLGFAISGLVALILVKNQYNKLQKKIDEVKQEIQPFVADSKDMFYKATDMMNMSKEILVSVKELSNKAKETLSDILDGAKEASNSVSNLVIDTNKKAKAHIEYVFDRVESIEEKLDEVYAYLFGIVNFVKKIKGDKDE
ncbi:hypothetical protein [Desulfurella sp.]|uniref:hypothetical protein n=1 Tax=Desulfurella sp. TaxID=1962857 RepID=UPI0025C3F6AE|nr:hypothetical protein [Desulfurella sp.]